MAISRNKKPATTVRYYLWREGDLLRVSKKLHHEILDGRVSVDAFAGSRQKIVEVFIEPITTSVCKVAARGTYYDFDARGLVDTVDLLHTAIDALGIGFRSTSKIVDLDQILKSKRFKQERTWSVPKELLEKIKGDIVGHGYARERVPRFKMP